MLAKKNRLTAAEVAQVLTKGRGARGRALSLKVMQAPPPFKCAVVVSKKLARTAVARNRIRRTVYNILRQNPFPRSGHVILFVQTLPKGEVAAFTSEIKKLLHV